MKGELIAPADEEVVDRESDPQASHDSELIEINDESEEAEPLRIAPSPKQPSAADVELHNITHWPYRSWSEECVKGRGLGVLRHRNVEIVDAVHRCELGAIWVVRDHRSNFDVVFPDSPPMKNV